MEGSSVIGIDRKSSIEKEPRTLNIDQIQYAREAALYVMRTRSIEEAMNVFMEGLKPVENTVRENDRMLKSQEELQYLGDELQQQPALRDVASAPF